MSRSKRVDNFDLALALLFSHCVEGTIDDRWPELLPQIREISPDAFNKILVGLQAQKDPDFEKYQSVDVSKFFKRMKVTSNVQRDAKRLIARMKRAHLEARRGTSNLTMAIQRALRKHGLAVTPAQIEQEWFGPNSTKEMSETKNEAVTGTV